jgi:hypothetical protein
METRRMHRRRLKREAIKKDGREEDLKYGCEENLEHDLMSR